MTLFLGCSSLSNEPSNINHDTALNNNRPTNKILFQKLNKLYVIGDFDGDGKNDTVFQHNFSKLHRAEIDSSPNVHKNDWDTVTKWFYDQKADVYLTINKTSQDTLHLGVAQGLYCLLNIGDNNSDGKDEIAFVVDYCDFSNTNSCEIYTVCNNKWTELKQFGVHEDAFVFTSDTMPIFKNVKGYLENRSGKWFYLNYDKDVIETQTMKQIKLNKCR